jgi:hypothetical protein
MDFLSSTAAIEFCELNRMDYIQIVLKFEQEKFDIVMQGFPLAEQGAQLRAYL